MRGNPDGGAGCGAERLTYRELDAEVGRIAAGLAARAVGKDDRVALLLGNRIEFVVLIFAVSGLGAIWVPLNIRDHPRDGFAQRLETTASSRLRFYSTGGARDPF